MAAHAQRGDGSGDMTRIVLRPVASSLPLGFFAFGTGTILLTALETISGWLGLPLAILSLYGGLALLLEEGTKRMVLPVGRRGRACASLEGDWGSGSAAPSGRPGSAASSEPRHPP